MKNRQLRLDDEGMVIHAVTGGSEYINTDEEDNVAVNAQISAKNQKKRGGKKSEERKVVSQ